MNSQMPSVRNETLQKQKSMRKFSVKIFVFSYSFLQIFIKMKREKRGIMARVIGVISTLYAYCNLLDVGLSN